MFLSIYYWEKLTCSKVVGKVNFLKKFFEEMRKLWNAKRYRVYIGGNVYFVIITFSCLLSTKLCLRYFLNCFVCQIKGFYQRSLLNEVDFKDIMNVSLNILAKNWENNINIFLSLENPCAFLTAKKKTWKRIFNTNSELSQNRTEKQVMPLKTTVSWLFNDIWCYLVIDCFDWNIGIFQQTVVRDLLYP